MAQISLEMADPEGAVGESTKQGATELSAKDTMEATVVTGPLQEAVAVPLKPGRGALQGSVGAADKAGAFGSVVYRRYSGLAVVVDRISISAVFKAAWVEPTQEMVPLRVTGVSHPPDMAAAEVAADMTEPFQ